MQTLDGVHVLLVEDDPDARTVMKIIMEYQGAAVITVTDAKSALSLLATMKPDVLVTDISMPQHDGFWLLQVARERALLNGTPVLAVTALEVDSRRLQDAGFDAYLRKPFDPNALCTTVQALSRGRKPASEAPP